jgi:adenine-specific DNA-methyltransferase
LDLIIKTSSNEGSIVLDCFCGSGTTLKSAQTNNRKWIGIDQSEYAIKATKEKLETIEGDLFTAKPDYEFIKLTDTIHGCQQRLNENRQALLNPSRPLI